MDNTARRKQLGEDIRKTRMERGLSQRQLALMLGVSSHTYIAEIEQGAKSVGYDKICAIADALGCEFSYRFIKL